MKTLLCWLLWLTATSSVIRANEAPLVTEGTVNAPVADVWALWTTSAGLRSWMAPLADIDLRIGGLMRVQYDPKGVLGDAKTVENRVLAYEPGRMLAIQVAKAPDDFPFRSSVGSMWTVLTFTPDGDGRTHLRIVGLGIGSDEPSKKMRSFFAQGNAYTLQLLQKRFSPPQTP